MKGIFTCILLTFSILSITLGQSNESVSIDTRLYNVYEEAYLNDLKVNNPFLLKRWAFYLDNAYYITDFPIQKGTPNYPKIEIDDLDNLNILLLEKNQNLKKNFDEKTFYRIEGTNKILVFYSGKEFNVKLNQYLQREF